jgi:hypothetical protein
MSQFKLTSLDGAYTFDTNIPATVTQRMETNLQTSDTQGFMIKRQAGSQRVRLDCVVTATKASIEANLLPQLNYPMDSYVTIDRNILGKSVKTVRAVVTGYEVTDEFDNGVDQAVRLTIVEVIGF